MEMSCWGQGSQPVADMQPKLQHARLSCTHAKPHTCEVVAVDSRTLSGLPKMDCVPGGQGVKAPCSPRLHQGPVLGCHGHGVLQGRCKPRGVGR